jgi:hypothetical protein
MGADYHYTPPKTDGTFGLRVNWAQLSSEQVRAAAPSIQPAPRPSLAAIAEQPLAVLGKSAVVSPSAWAAWYRDAYLRSSKIPSSRVLVHVIAGTALVGFAMHYGKNAAHTYAKHH